MPHLIPSRILEKAIVKGAKKVIAASGLNSSTRSGNQELSHWASSLAGHPFATVDAAHQYGMALGQKIAERSQTLNKQHLDGGTIRQLRSQKDLPPLPDSATPSVSAAVAAPPVPPTMPSAPPINSPPLEEAMPDTEAMTETPDTLPEIVSIPVETPKSTAEAATIGAIEDEDVIPADPEQAKVDIDPTPEVTTTAEEPKSVVESVAQADAIADADADDAVDDDTIAGTSADVKV